MGSQTGRAKNAGVKFTIPINPRTPIAIKAYLNQLEEPVMYVVHINQMNRLKEPSQ
ncbi:hypothetical protein [Pyrococcus kukulkanii]|uniref:hypothetical protein n=1 Tax=Pyrococcus kukulkanii TaxID=1609559 RepID=UPI00137A9151|nr:hypothetical protein [Pyrococcus kukulkanii]